MDDLGSPNNLNDQDVLPLYQLGGNTAITLPLIPLEREPPLRGPQLSPQTEAQIFRFQQPMGAVAGTAGQQLQFQSDVIINIDDQGPVEALPEYNTGRVEDPIWRLRLHAAYSFGVATIIGVLFLPDDLHKVHATYQRAQLVASVGAPIAVAVFTFMSSFWFASDPEGWSNWITVLSRVNVGMTGAGPLAFNWMRNRGIAN